MRGDRLSLLSPGLHQNIFCTQHEQFLLERNQVTPSKAHTEDAHARVTSLDMWAVDQKLIGVALCSVWSPIQWHGM